MGEFITVGPESDVNEGEMKAFKVAGLNIAVARVGERLHAFGNTCTHRQCPLSKGELEEATVTCPCHGSQFDVTTGDVIRGPAEDPVPSYPVRLEQLSIQVDV
jgi:3-phenylpropionate/trans-cinnamate dioxygenase ferredoxin subunit